MKKLVYESLEELYEGKKENVAIKKDDKGKSADIKNTKEKAEKTKPVKVKQDDKERAKEAIAALKQEIAKAKKPGAFKTIMQKEVKIKELEDKIKSWEKRIK